MGSWTGSLKDFLVPKLRFQFSVSASVRNMMVNPGSGQVCQVAQGVFQHTYVFCVSVCVCVSE